MNRVTITSVNGKDFDPKATYVVVTNDFTAAGGDTYYTFKTSPKIVDTGVPMDTAVVEYIKTKLGGVVGKSYASAQNRIAIKSYTDVVSTAWYAKYVDDVTAKELMGGSNGKFDPNGNMNRAMLVTVLYRMAGSPTSRARSPRSSRTARTAPIMKRPFCGPQRTALSAAIPTAPSSPPTRSTVRSWPRFSTVMMSLPSALGRILP